MINQIWRRRANASTQLPVLLRIINRSRRRFDVDYVRALVVASRLGNVLYAPKVVYIHTNALKRNYQHIWTSQLPLSVRALEIIDKSRGRNKLSAVWHSNDQA